MKLFSSDTRKPVTILSAVSSILIILAASSFAVAQQKVSRRFPAGKNVRFELKNVTGTITVETWQRDEIMVTALMDNRKATFNPRQTDTGLVIDIVGDNRGRGDIGDMNFKIQLPVRSSVDLETRSGQINVSNIQGDPFSLMASLPPAAPTNSSRAAARSVCNYRRIVAFTSSRRRR